MSEHVNTKVVPAHEAHDRASSRKRSAPDQDDEPSAQRTQALVPYRQVHHGSVADGHAKQHNGNNINTYHGPVQIWRDPSESARQRHDPIHQVLESLRFKEMQDRYQTSESECPNTCGWLLETPEYKAWQAADREQNRHSFLWVKGKPGAGKSTLMKFAHRNAGLGDRNTKTATFFFHARGVQLQHCAEGMYRSLLAQIFAKIPRLQTLLSSQRCRDVWPAPMLRELFREVVRSLDGEALTCYIDALDECAASDVQDTMKHFVELGALSMQATCHFRLLLSSRHYPGVSLPTCIQLDIDKQLGHIQDISEYVNVHLDNREPSLKAELCTRILQKASGVFLWVYLVVPILNKDIAEGKAHWVRRRLEELPSRLHTLLERILEGGSQESPYLLPALLWVLFAKKPLTTEELHFAILLSAGEAIPIDRAKLRLYTSTTQDFIIDSSRGLVESTASGAQTQLIHECVREYLITAGLAMLDAALVENVRGLSHVRLGQACQQFVDYVFNDMVPTADLPGKRNGFFPLWSLSCSEPFAFLEACLDGVLYHAELAQINGLRQEATLKSFPLASWHKVFNEIQRSPDDLYAEHADLIYILADRGHAALLETWLLCMPTATRDSVHIDTALQVAIRRENLVMIATLIHHGARPADEQQKGILLDMAHEATDEALIAELDSCGILSDPASHCRHGHERRVALLKAGAGSDEPSSKREYPLVEACKAGHADVVALLLEAGADVNCTAHPSSTPLQVASHHQRWDICRLLLEYGADIESRGHDLPAPDLSGLLLLEVTEGNVDGVEELLALGVDVNGSPTYQTALQEACLHEHWGIVDVLLNHGADVNASKLGSPPALYIASSKGKADVVRKLLVLGADIDQETARRETAIGVARRDGRWDVVEILHGDEYELVPKKSSPAVTQSELFDEESDVLPRTTRRRSLLDFIKAKPMIGVALLFGLGGSLACFGYTFWLSRQRFACPHWALQCQIASKVQLYVNNKATLQGFLSAVFGLSVFMLAYATYQMAETTIWPVVLRQSLKWKDIDVYLAASRGSIVATVEALLNIRGSRHLVVLFIVLAVALLLQANAIIVGYTFENVNIPTV